MQDFNDARTRQDIDPEQPVLSDVHIYDELELLTRLNTSWSNYLSRLAQALQCEWPEEAQLVASGFDLRCFSR